MMRMLFIVGSLRRGGAETFAMKLFRATLGRDDILIDFLSSGPGVYDKEVRDSGRSVFYVGLRTRSLSSVLLSIESIVRYGRYDFVLKFSDSSLSALDLMAARKGGAKVTAARSMNSKPTGSSSASIAHLLLRPLLRRSADIWIAPSQEAGSFMFGNKGTASNSYLHLPNALPLKDYYFSEKERNAVRDELGLTEGNLLVGFAGRLMEQKNPIFLVQAFADLLSSRPEARLVVVGDGPLRELMEESARALGVNLEIFFIKPRDNVRALYSAMDVLWLPSLFEGMPNVVIEAQASGLPCLVSDKVTREVALTRLVQHLPLEKELWAEETFALEKGNRLALSSEACLALKAQGYEISNSLGMLKDRVAKVFAGG